MTAALACHADIAGLLSPFSDESRRAAVGGVAAIAAWLPKREGVPGHESTGWVASGGPSGARVAALSAI